MTHSERSDRGTAAADGAMRMMRKPGCSCFFAKKLHQSLMHRDRCFEGEPLLKDMSSGRETRGGHLDERAVRIMSKRTGARQDCSIVALDWELMFTATQPPSVAASMMRALLCASSRMCSMDAMPQRAIIDSSAQELRSPTNTMGQLARPGLRNICSKAE